MALRVDRVSKRYGDHQAVKGLSFEVPKGVVFGILGPNGAGKTTTLRMINDIVAPDMGEIRLFGTLPPGRRAAESIGYLPEERGLYPKMRVDTMLCFFGQLRGLSSTLARDRVQTWLARLDIANWRRSRVQDLSKGMQQKVQFIAALLHEPELLILDEPWSGLDPVNATTLRAAVLEQREKGRTVLFSTHLMAQAETICDSVCIVAGGTKVLEGRVADLLKGSGVESRVRLEFVDSGGREAAGTVFGDVSIVESVVSDRDGVTEIALVEGIRPEVLLARLGEARILVRKFVPVRPSLHDIFIKTVARAGSDSVDES